MIRVLFLTLYPASMPSSRLRVYQYLPYLGQFGIESTVLPALPEPWFSRFYYSPSKWIHGFQYAAEVLGNLGRIFESRRYDVVFIQKGILTTNFWGFDRLHARANRHLIFDLDDLVYGRSVVEFRWPLLRALQDRHQTEKISSSCRAVVAGNSYLQSLALQFNQKVFLIPTPIDTNRFRPRTQTSQSREDEIVIGWIGVGRGLAYVRLLERIFQTLSRRYRIRLKLITGPAREPFGFRETAVDLVPWSHETEVSEMERFDIGISPLVDDEYARGKCGFKLLQYMAMGTPSVVSRLGVHPEIVEEGVDGFLAQKEEEWIGKLSRLIEDESLRKRVGEAARKKAVEKYSLEKMVPRFAAVLKEAAR